MTRRLEGAALIRALERRLDPVAREILSTLVAEADARGEPLYAVGGVVRELLWDRQGRSGQRSRGVAGSERALDLDLASAAEPWAVASEVAARLGAEALRHERFGTASLRLGAVTVDLARCRRERYARAGALPSVEPASIETDLGRRDFTINAMALGLSGEARGLLLDPYGGQADLRRGLIRTLHAGSFRDDPTRLIRACRYAARIGGRFAPGTGREARASLRHVASLSDDRFGEAWRRLLTDPAAAEALRRAAALRLSEARLPGWTLSSGLLRAFRSGGRESADEFWALSGLTLPAEVSARLPRSCGLTREERRALEDGAALRAKRPALGAASLSPHAAADRLRPHGAAAVGAAGRLWRGRAGDRARRYEETWAGIGPPIDAGSLAALGVPRGPETGVWLRRLRDAVIDGELPDGRRGAAAARRFVRERVHSASLADARGRAPGGSEGDIRR